MVELGRNAVICGDRIDLMRWAKLWEVFKNPEPIGKVGGGIGRIAASVGAMRIDVNSFSAVAVSFGRTMRGESEAS